MLTFLDNLFDKPRDRSRNTQSPQKYKTEYHGVATAVGKLSKRLRSIEVAIASTPEDTPTPTKNSKTPVPEPVTTETPTVPIVITPPKADTVTPLKEPPIVKAD